MTPELYGLCAFVAMMAVCGIGMYLESRSKRNKRGTNLPPPDSSCRRDYSENWR